ncbi:MAG: putative enzyme related to lactoylglutathione lyase [Myxococcota bacterium]|jgi:predicted enzyme related to lactoylglutathione lyase
MITGVQDVYLNVSSMERALAFYEGILGLRVMERSDWWSALDVGGIRVGLHGTGAEAVPPIPRDDHGPFAGAVLTLRTDDIDADVAHLTAAGVHLLGPVSRHPWGALVPLEDPDGNVIKLMQPPRHPHWRQVITYLDTRDMAEMHRFYADVLGMGLALDQGASRVYRVGTDGFIGVRYRERGAAPGGTTVTLVVPDLEAKCAALVAEGVQFERPMAYDAASAVTRAVLRDPAGHAVELRRFEDSNWV